MKNFILGLIACLVIVALGFAVYYVHHNVTASQVESVEIQTDIPETGFATSQEAILFKTNMANQEYYDSVFVAMPNDVIDDVATVLIGQCGFTTQNDIVDEYLTNQRIYDELMFKRRKNTPDANKTNDSAVNNTPANKEESTTNRPRDSQENKDTTASEKEIKYKLVKIE